MTEEKIKEIVNSYRKFFQENGVTAKKQDHKRKNLSKKEKLEHLCYMINKISIWLKKGKKTKYFVG